MSLFWPFEISINIFLQNLGFWLSPMMFFFSFLCQQDFFILLLPIVYWCFDSSLAIRLTFLLSFSVFSNTLLKISFHGARPYWIDKRVLAISSENSFGFPSGHAQHAVSIWGYFSTIVNKTWQRLFFFFLIFMIGFSRLYLGVHFLSDVIGGWIFGILILFLFITLEKPFLKWFNLFSDIRKILLISFLTLLIIFFGVFYTGYQSQFVVPESWLANVLSNMHSININPYLLKDYISLCSVFWGFSVGNIFLSSKMIYNPLVGSISQKVTRIFIGLVGVIIILSFFSVFPSNFLANFDLLFHFIRYGIISIWVSAFAPLLFKKIKLL